MAKSVDKVALLKKILSGNAGIESLRPPQVVPVYQKTNEYTVSGVVLTQAAYNQWIATLRPEDRVILFVSTEHPQITV